ncbi:MAG TPA: translation elongation factor Ts [Stellaceae bacterium]|nr:translation elongation factor Ts [Stellaceae bacterium]
MAEITAGLVKELRDKTGAGMMDCKQALGESGGDIEAAVDWLRKKGLAAAAKKAGRVAAEGLIGVNTKGGAGAVVEVNSETDFVARNELFQQFVRTVGQIALAGDGSLESLQNAAYPGTGRNVAAELTELLGRIGENLVLRRVAKLEVSPGIVASYVHNSLAPGLGKIGVLMALESTAGEAALAGIGRQLAMHVAAANPQYLDTGSVPGSALDRERAVLREQAKTSGKADAIIDKMVDGRLRKFYEDNVLLEQIYVIDGESRVNKVLETAAKEAGAPIRIAGFVRFQIGEGIDRPTSDLAADVAAQLAR